MNINRGDRMDYLTSLSSNDFSMAPDLVQLAKEDPFYETFAGKKYRGNMNTTLVKTALGRSIMIQHDTSSPRPYSRIHLISGTKGAARKWPSPERIALGHSWLKEDEQAALAAQYNACDCQKGRGDGQRDRRPRRNGFHNGLEAH